jgi:hypothetical protein
MAGTSSHPDACVRLLSILGPEQADATLRSCSEMATLFPSCREASQVRFSFVPLDSAARTSMSCLLNSCEIYSLTENDSYYP